MTAQERSQGDDIAAAYRTALDRLVDPDESELLPVRLAEAVAAVLPVDGAGLSLFDREFRVPLGASGEAAGEAERLQFTQGQGPCLAAGRQRRVLACERADLTAEWPSFAAELFARTPYRAVLTLPLTITSATSGALDLFFIDDPRMRAVGLSDAARVAEEIVGCLSRVTVAAGLAATEDVDLPWLASPAAGARTVVWLAVGVVQVRFNLSAENALALLRAHAFGSGRLLDDAAAAIVNGTLPIEELRP